MESWDGTISARDFHASASAFCERWKRSKPDFPPWNRVAFAREYQASSHHRMNGYLTLEKLCLSQLIREPDLPPQERLQEETTLSEEDEPVDSATLLVESNQGAGVHYYDFHIVYSASYRVPVLFFRAYRIDGQPLAMDEIEEALPASSAKALLESKWTFITQEEHPYLKRPWLKLHPCGTSEWMKLLFQSDSFLAKNGVPVELYLASWLSVVGQVVGLRIPPEMMNNPS